MIMHGFPHKSISRPRDAPQDRAPTMPTAGGRRATPPPAPLAASQWPRDVPGERQPTPRCVRFRAVPRRVSGDWSPVASCEAWTSPC